MNNTGSILRDPVVVAATQAFVSPNEQDLNGEPANIVDALFALTRAVARLGIQEADTDKGAIEGHTFEVRAGMEAIAAGLHDIADAIRSASTP